MSHIDQTALQNAILSLLTAIRPEDPQREGLQDTPRRVAKAFAEWTAGYQVDVDQLLSTTFAGGGYDQMIYIGPTAFYSLCEHHLAPFVGAAHVAYVPNPTTNRIVGLSKVPKLVHAFAQRLQVQERMTKQIADALMSGLDPFGVAVFVEAQHLCMCSRGVRARETWTSTSDLRGAFQHQSAKEEFFFKVGRGDR